MAGHCTQKISVFVVITKLPSVSGVSILMIRWTGKVHTRAHTDLHKMEMISLSGVQPSTVTAGLLHSD